VRSPAAPADAAFAQDARPRRGTRALAVGATALATVAVLGTAALIVGRRRPSTAAANFQARYERALADPRLARNLLAFQRAWRPARDAAFADLTAQRAGGHDEGTVGSASSGAAPADPAAATAHHPTAGDESAFAVLRAEMAAVKDRVIADLPDYFAQFRVAAERAGAVVVEAADAEAANAYVAELARRRGARLVVKSKSMVSEETELNHYLEARGVEVLETDLGEWIVQLAHERPSHMVMPAIHKSRQQVGELFTRVLGREIPRESVPEQVQVARVELRHRFLEADIGISGANALIAESGTIMLITNEGNGRMVTSLSPVHVVLVGYEKLVPRFEDAVRQLRLLGRSATGQHLTSYTTFITGPDRPDKELHIVFLDNGRLAMRADLDMRAALRCIRCAACANVCPPYQVVGGHVFGYIYSGAIGLVNTPFHHGVAHAAGPQSLCVSCNACATVCPVGIPLPRQILNTRARIVERLGLPVWKRLLLAVWSRPRSFDLACRIASLTFAPFARGHFLRGLPLPPAWRWRTPPRLARRPARDRLRRRVTGPPAEPAAGRSVACFLQCIADRFVPEAAEATVAVVEACGARVVLPPGQHCCGLPALDAGDLPTARRMARQTIAVLDGVSADYVVTPAPSCAVAIAHDYPGLFAEEPDWHARAVALGPRVLDLTTFVTRIARLAPRPPAAPVSEAITYHPFCQSTNVLGLAGQAEELIRDVLGVPLRDLPEAEVCCGFGGSTSADHPAVARQIAARKLANVAASGATTLVTDNPGCLIHLRGAADASGQRLRVVHLAQLVAAALRRRESDRAGSVV
jgi:iron-sulfur cluster protein